MQIVSASPTLLLNAILAKWAQFCKDCYIISTCTPSCPAIGTAWLWWLAWAGAWLCYPLMWLSIYNKEWDITVIQPISSTSTLELFKKALVDIWIDLYLIKFQFLAILCRAANRYGISVFCTDFTCKIREYEFGLENTEIELCQFCHLKYCCQNKAYLFWVANQSVFVAFYALEPSNTSLITKTFNLLSSTCSSSMLSCLTSCSCSTGSIH